MKKFYDMLKDNVIFDGIDNDEFEKMLACIGARTQNFNKDEIIILAGEFINFIGLIISGSVKIIKEDVEGKISILTELSISEVFGEAFAFAGIDRSPVTVRASDKCEVLIINYKKIITTCSAVCSSHSKLIENMLRLIAKKNILLNQKIEILSKRTTREKLLMFFDIQRNKAKKFTIPYNREELAHYLCVDRSAMSNELCKMRDDGLIKFNKNEFEILYSC